MTFPVRRACSRWDRLIRDIADEHGVYVTLTNLVGSEGGKIFPGGSFVAGPKGEVARTRAALGGRDSVGHRRSRRRDARARRHAAHRRPRDDGPASARRASTRRWRARRRRSPSIRRRSTRRDSGIAPSDSDGIRPGRSPSCASAPSCEQPPAPLEIDAALTEQWLVALHPRRDGAPRIHVCAVVGVSGGVDSAVTAYLAARRSGPRTCSAFGMPYRTSSQESLDHAQLVIDALGIQSRTIDISAGGRRLPRERTRRRRRTSRQRHGAHAHDHAVRSRREAPRHSARHGEQDRAAVRLLHLARRRLAADQSARRSVQDAGAGRSRGTSACPRSSSSKPPTADLVVGQTDEGDFGISYAKADEILNWLLHGYTPASSTRAGSTPTKWRS